ncbi:hypothetical protein ACHAXT_010547 [Thalassiosira profunda]
MNQGMAVLAAAASARAGLVERQAPNANGQIIDEAASARVSAGGAASDGSAAQSNSGEMGRARRVAGEKENLTPANSNANTLSVAESRPAEGSHSKAGKAERKGSPPGMVRNGTNLGGVGLSYFDEGNVLGGAVCGPCNDSGDSGDFREEGRSPLPSQHDVDGYANYSNNYNAYDDGEDDDEGSDASGDTVVHNDLPPPPANATREERNRHYWEWCYGPLEEGEEAAGARGGGSGMKSAPAKSCLSTKKRQKEAGDASMTPRRILQHSPHSSASCDDTVMEEAASSSADPTTPAEEAEDSTPKNNVTRLRATDLRKPTQSAVKFGTNAAAEFDCARPITEMTPLPTAVVLEIFPSEMKATEREVEESHETAQNVKTLAEWDDDFDDLVDGDDEENGGGANRRERPRKRGRRRTPYKLTGGRSRSQGLLSRPRKSRRESSIFSRERKSLVDPIDDDERDGSMEMDESQESEGSGGAARGSLLPFEVAIDPEEYTSPSSTSVSDGTLGTPGVLPTSGSDSLDSSIQKVAQPTREEDARDSLESRTSACISPGSLRSEISKPADTRMDESFDSVDLGLQGIGRHGPGRDSGDTTASGKATPNSARTSSSTILRAVHASGALLHGNSPPPPQGAGGAPAKKNGGRLMPNQLRYSPSSSSGSSAGLAGMDVSPSDSNCTLGSDILSLFTHHSLDDDAEPSLGDKLAVFSSHPALPFHTCIGDLLQWAEGSGKVVSALLSEHVLKGLSPQTSLALMAEATTEDSCWLQSALSEAANITRSAVAQTSIESILLYEMNKMGSAESSPAMRTTTAPADADASTVASCMALCHGASSLDWSRRELDAATRALGRLRELAKNAKKETKDCEQLVASRCEKLAEASKATMELLGKSSASTTRYQRQRLALRKRKVQSEMEDELASIKSLEDEMAVEADRLGEAKRARATLRAHLELEKASPASVIYSEIHSSIAPGAATTNTTNFTLTATTNTSDFTFSLLDGSAEISTRISSHDGIESMDLGCFIKDGGPAIKLLQAILLGDVEMKADRTDPIPLRASLASAITRTECRQEAFLQMAHLFSRIDNLIRSARELESNGLCTVESSVDGDVRLSVSMLCEGTVVQICFVFSDLLGSDWQVTTAPDVVNVSIAKAERDLSSLGNQLQEKARSTLARATSSDPVLLRRICNEVWRDTGRLHK